MYFFIVSLEQNEERMMVDPSSREDPKVKELLQVCNILVLCLTLVVHCIHHV